jgi:hypothetical protein
MHRTDLQSRPRRFEFDSTPGCFSLGLGFHTAVYSARSPDRAISTEENGCHLNGTTSWGSVSRDPPASRCNWSPLGARGDYTVRGKEQIT